MRVKPAFPTGFRVSEATEAGAEGRWIRRFANRRATEGPAGILDSMSRSLKERAQFMLRINWDRSQTWSSVTPQ
jgi:hypothetical protein